MIFDEVSNPNSWGMYSQREKRKNLLAWVRKWFILDGLVWHRTGEPRYVVMTFGLGHNHGLGWGTSLSEDTGYNSNIGKQRYFRIDQEAAAVVEATRIAENRGDTEALPISKQGYARYDIFLPEAVRCQPSKEHGNGDPFINSIEKIINASPDSNTAGLLAMAMTAMQK